MLDASTSRPPNPDAGERAQQLRRREVVVADVLRQVAEVDADADHRRLVRDGAGAGDRAGRDVRVAQVALDPLRAVRRSLGALAVRRGQQRVDDPHGMAGGQQALDDVRADEAGAAGHEDHVSRIVMIHPRAVT